MKHRLFMFMLVGSLIGFGQNTYRFSVEEAVSFALSHNKEAINAEKSIQSAQKQKWEAIAKGLPSIDVQGNYQHAIEQQKSLIPAQMFGGKQGEFLEVAFGTKDNLSAHATLSQLIFSGSYIVGVQSAKVYSLISKLSKEKTNQQIRKAVVQAYVNVLLLDKSIDIIKHNLEALEKNLSETKKIFENGLTEEENVEQLQITYSQIKNQLQQTERLFDWSKKMLNIALGIPTETAVTLTDNIESLVNTYIAESIVQTDFNFENNIDYKIAKNRTQAQKLLLRNEKMKLLPTISAFINAGYDAPSNNGFDFLSSNQKWLGSAIAGVSVQIPIFSSWGKGAAIQRQSIELEKSKNELWQTQEQIKLNYDKAVSDLQFSIQHYQTLKNNLDLAQRIEKKNQIKFAEGMSGSFDLRQAQLQLYSAQQEYLQAALDLIVKKEELNNIIKSY